MEKKDFTNGIEGLKSKPKDRPILMTISVKKPKSDKPLHKRRLLKRTKTTCENALLKKLDDLIQARKIQSHNGIKHEFRFRNTFKSN
jgi:hypothetical protein